MSLNLAFRWLLSLPTNTWSQFRERSIQCFQLSVCLSVCSDDNDTKCSKLLRASLRGTSGIAQYPVRWTAQSALHFLPSLTDLFIPIPFSASPGSILAMQQLRATTKSLTFQPLSIARYSFIQLSRQGRQWREGKCPIFQTVAKEDSNPGSLDCESGILPLSYRAPLKRYVYLHYEL